MGRKRRTQPVNGQPPDPAAQQRHWDSEVVCQWAQHVQERSAAVERARVALVEAREHYKHKRRFLREMEGMLTTALAQPPGTFPLFDRKPSAPELPRADPAADPRKAVRDLYKEDLTPALVDYPHLAAELRERSIYTTGALLDASMVVDEATFRWRLRLLCRHAVLGTGEDVEELADWAYNRAVRMAGSEAEAELLYPRVGAIQDKEEAHA